MPAGATFPLPNCESKEPHSGQRAIGEVDFSVCELAVRAVDRYGEAARRCAVDTLPLGIGRA